MRCVGMQAKDVYTLVEMSLTELEKLKRGLEACSLNLNMADNFDKNVSHYMTEELYPFVCELVKSVKEGGADVAPNT